MVKSFTNNTFCKQRESNFTNRVKLQGLQGLPPAAGSVKLLSLLREREIRRAVYCALIHPNALKRSKRCVQFQSFEVRSPFK
jgi:hypothetical protein